MRKSHFGEDEDGVEEVSDAKNHFVNPNGTIWGFILQPDSDPRDDHERLIFGSLFGHPCARCGGEVIPHCAPKPGTSINRDIYVDIINEP